MMVVNLIGGGQSLTAPGAFTGADWTVANAFDAAGDTLTVPVSMLPDDGGSAITDIEYRLDGGSAVSSGIAAPDTFAIDGLTPDVEVTVELRAVNAEGDGPWGDVQSATPTAPPSEDWPVAWVSNTISGLGNGCWTYDGVLGTDSTRFEAFFLLKNLESLPAAQGQLFYVANRHEIYFDAAGRLNVILKNATPTTLVHWVATSAFGAGQFAIHIAADLAGTPTFAVSALNLASPSWAATPGSYTTGPTAGTLDHTRTATGPDYSLLSRVFGNRASVHYGALWLGISNGALVGRDAFHNGSLQDPETIGAPTILYIGPASNKADNKGSAGNFSVTASGSFTDV
jgi:hypothetical protein